MALTLQIVDGEVVDNKSQDTSQTTTNSMVDQDLFLQLLVAEMKYQDPLEPTTNTEWVSQYATFTQVEQMTALADSAEEIEAASLVGKTVIMKSTDKSGDTNYFSGTVSYLEKVNDEVQLCVTGTSGEQLFTLDELDSIVDPDYLEAITLADTFDAIIGTLPSVNNVTSSSKSQIEAARAAYDSMTDYQKSFVNSESLLTLQSLEKAVANMS